MSSLTMRLKLLTVDLGAAPNLVDLRRALGSLIETAQDLEAQILDVRLSDA